MEVRYAMIILIIGVIPAFGQTEIELENELNQLKEELVNEIN